MIAARFAHKLAAMIAAGALLLSSAADACTGIRLTAADGTVVHARTLEFAVDIHSDVLVSPRGYARMGVTPDGKDGLTWKAKYASVGANGVGTAGHHRRPKRGGARGGTVLLPDHRRLSALRARRTRPGPSRPGSSDRGSSTISPASTRSRPISARSSSPRRCSSNGAFRRPCTPSSTTRRARASPSNMSAASSTSTTIRSESSPIRRASTGT